MPVLAPGHFRDGLGEGPGRVPGDSPHGRNDSRPPGGNRPHRRDGRVPVNPGPRRRAAGRRMAGWQCLVPARGRERGHKRRSRVGRRTTAPRPRGRNRERGVRGSARVRRRAAPRHRAGPERSGQTLGCPAGCSGRRSPLRGAGRYRMAGIGPVNLPLWAGDCARHPVRGAGRGVGPPTCGGALRRCAPDGRCPWPRTSPRRRRRVPGSGRPSPVPSLPTLRPSVSGLRGRRAR